WPRMATPTISIPGWPPLRRRSWRSPRALPITSGWATRCTGGGCGGEKPDTSRREPTLTLSPERLESRPRPSVVGAVGYGLMVVLTIALFLLICSHGKSLVAPPAESAWPINRPAAAGDVFLRVLVALTAIIVTGQALARL